MSWQLKEMIVPAYLFVSLIAGGSAQGIWNNAVLQLMAVVLIVWAAWSSAVQQVSRASRYLLTLAAGGIALIVIQLLPLPPAIWSALGGRDVVVAGYRLLGINLPWLPLSLDGYDTLAASYAVLPPLATALAMIARQAFRESWIASAVLAGAISSVVMGAVQTASGFDVAWTQFYRFTSPGATGFFANRNHMATLLVSAIPFAAAMYALANATTKQRQKAFALFVSGAGGFLLLVVGIALNSSLAALALSVPVIVVSALLIVPPGLFISRLVTAIGSLGLAGAIIVMSTSSISDISGGASSFRSREEIWSLTSQAIAKSFPAGTGLSTFRQVYAIEEAPAEVTNTYVNHAHNDYLEWILETGLLGLLLVLAFLAWWARYSFRVWRSPVSSAFAKAATIASAAILAHSIVDYPLRSPAIAVLFAACLAIIALHERKGRVHDVKHVSIA